MRGRKLLMSLLVLVMFSTAVLAQAPAMPKAGPEQQRLRYFVGEWKAEGEMKPGPFGPGGKFTTTDHNEMLGDFFLLLNSKGTGPMGPITEIGILGYDSKAKSYTYDNFNTMGIHEHSTGQVQGKTWTWTNEGEMGGMAYKGKFVLTETSPTSYSYHFDVSSDGGAWTTAMEGKATKVSAKR